MSDLTCQWHGPFTGERTACCIHHKELDMKKEQTPPTPWPGSNPNKANPVERPWTEGTESKVGATCVVVENADGLVLAVSRKDDPRDFGLPGGKMEPGDVSSEACARRELEEETGVYGRKLVSVFTGPARTPGRLSQAFYAIDHQNTPQLRERGSIGWVAWEVLYEGSFGAYNRNLKAALDARPPCSELTAGAKVTYVDDMGNTRRCEVLRVTSYRVFLRLADDVPGEIYFDYDEVHRLVRDGS